MGIVPERKSFLTPPWKNNIILLNDKDVEKGVAYIRCGAFFGQRLVKRCSVQCPAALREHLIYELWHPSLDAPLHVDDSSLSLFRKSTE